MGEYFNYYGTALDNTTKHVVTQQAIETYERGILLYFLRPWKLRSRLRLGPHVQIIGGSVNDQGKGWVNLKDGRATHTFYAYERAADLTAEVTRACS